MLTGGASATYGSDAVAGVVNFTMKDDFEGISFDVQRSAFYHDNNGNVTANRMVESGHKPQSGGISDGDIENMSMIIGGNLEDGRGNVTAYATYINIKGVTQSERDYSGCALGSGRTACGGSGTNAAGSFYCADGFYFNMVNSEFVPWDAVQFVQLRGAQLLPTSGQALHVGRVRALRRQRPRHGLHPADVHERPDAGAVCARGVLLRLRGATSAATTRC